MAHATLGVEKAKEEQQRNQGEMLLLEIRSSCNQIYAGI